VSFITLSYLIERDLISQINCFPVSKVALKILVYRVKHGVTMNYFVKVVWCSLVGERTGVYSVLVGILRERDHWGDMGVDGRVILRWIFKEWERGAWTGLSWLWIGTGGGHLQMR
jgi:hypothetical protein